MSDLFLNSTSAEDLLSQSLRADYKSNTMSFDGPCRITQNIYFEGTE